MVAYEFYERREMMEDKLIGILPERRRHPDRITQESILNWVRKLLGKDEHTRLSDVYFVHVQL